MIKPVDIPKDVITVDGEPVTHIGPFTKSELTDMVRSGIVDVFVVLTIVCFGGSKAGRIMRMVFVFFDNI